FDNLLAAFEAQKAQIKKLSEVRAQIAEKQARRAYLRKKKQRGLHLTPEEVLETEAVTAVLAQLQAEDKVLESFFAGAAVLRWDARDETYAKGYMVGVLVCTCKTKKLGACSGKAPPGFARSIASSGFQLVSDPVVPRAEAAAEDPWACAAKQLV
ncbi:hypothetical protein, partial [Staphylococcus aureus]|uniref:hypothetical protein n=1 Tax=Staphylococcus aureus TaxID=1280 RepID=UPI003F8139BD